MTATCLAMVIGAFCAGVLVVGLLLVVSTLADDADRPIVGRGVMPRGSAGPKPGHRPKSGTTPPKHGPA